MIPPAGFIIVFQDVEARCAHRQVRFACSVVRGLFTQPTVTKRDDISASAR
jgi:hypothetical protein